MSVLVTGGAGYIGSHTVAELVAAGSEVIVLDNLEKGHRQAVETSNVKLVVGDLRDLEFIRNVLQQHNINSVIHFAAYSEAGESMTNPLKYYNNNIIASLNLLTAMQEAGVKRIVFSSTAAVYGEPEHIPIVETDRLLPINPYGETKLAVEKALRWSDQAYGIKHVILRYFNAAGAHSDSLIGENHTPETHLIPLVLKTALGQRESIKLFGQDYPTTDGTCIRDYIHVTDLAQAHILAYEYLKNSETSNIFNLGNGQGFSNQEVINVARQITGRRIQIEDAPRRPGDPAVLVASSEKAKIILGWEPQFASLPQIIESAWNWHRNHPNGYAALASREG